MAGSGPTPDPSGQGNWGGAPGQPGAGGVGGAGGFQVKPAEIGPAPGIAYAELGIRIGAYIIDAVILSVAYFVVAGIVGAAMLGSLFTTGLGFIFVIMIVLGALYLVGSAVYFIYSWTRLRASPGQKMLGLETVNATNGGTLTQAQAIRRWAFLFGLQALVTVLQFGSSWFVYTFGFMGILSMLLSLASLAYAIYLLYTVTQSGKRQGFHDVQAGTVVIKRLTA
jgi:uncharacterized RDD family membrane protein YckC